MLTISQVLSQHTKEWMQLPGVTGTGEGEKDGKPAVIIFVEHSSKELQAKLPQEMNGYPVVIEETGRVRTF
jgi:hypothetical protein